MFLYAFHAFLFFYVLLCVSLRFSVFFPLVFFAASFGFLCYIRSFCSLLLPLFCSLLLPFVLIAASFGIEFLKFSTYSSLFADLPQVFMSKGPKFIEVILNPDEELEPKCSAIIKSDGSIVSMPLEDMSPLLPIEVLEREMMGNLSPQSLEARESD